VRYSASVAVVAFGIKSGKTNIGESSEKGKGDERKNGSTGSMTTVIKPLFAGTMRMAGE